MRTALRRSVHGAVCLAKTHANILHRGHGRTSMALLRASRSEPICGGWRASTATVTISASTSPRRAHPAPCMVRSMASKAPSPVTSTWMPAATVGIGPILVRRTGISTRWFRAPISMVLRNLSAASAPGSTETPSRVRLKPAIRSAGTVAEFRAADTGDLATRLVVRDAGADLDHLVRPRRRVHRARRRAVAGDFWQRRRGCGSLISRATCGGDPMASTPSRSMASVSRQAATAAPRSKAVVASPAG